MTRWNLMKSLGRGLTLASVTLLMSPAFAGDFCRCLSIECPAPRSAAAFDAIRADPVVTAQILNRFVEPVRSRLAQCLQSTQADCPNTPARLRVTRLEPSWTDIMSGQDSAARFPIASIRVLDARDGGFGSHAARWVTNCDGGYELQLNAARPTEWGRAVLATPRVETDQLFWNPEARARSVSIFSGHSDDGSVQNLMGRPTGSGAVGTYDLRNAIDRWRRRQEQLRPDQSRVIETAIQGASVDRRDLLPIVALPASCWRGAGSSGAVTLRASAAIVNDPLRPVWLQEALSSDAAARAQCDAMVGEDARTCFATFYERTPDLPSRFALETFRGQLRQRIQAAPNAWEGLALRRQELAVGALIDPGRDSSREARQLRTDIVQSTLRDVCVSFHSETAGTALTAMQEGPQEEREANIALMRQAVMDTLGELQMPEGDAAQRAFYRRLKVHCTGSDSPHVVQTQDQVVNLLQRMGQRRN